jgi:hypothetical protein
MTEPVVDVIIPVHTSDRPIARAVNSVLAEIVTPTRVTVVCHGVRVAAIAHELEDRANDRRVRLLEYEDGVPSPAGPINAGLDAADAEFTSLLDSDDTYETGAIDAWLAVQRRDAAAAVIPTLRYASGASTRTPPTRPGRHRLLDGTRDRLAYRTRQHGLLSREHFAEVRMTPGLRSGEDVAQGAGIWFSGAPVSFARKAPGYLIHFDGGERTSTVHKSAQESLLFLDALLEGPLWRALGSRERESFAVKLLRTHVIDILANALGGASRADLTALRDAIGRVEVAAPTALDVLSRRDARILRHLSAPQLDLDWLRHEMAIRTDFRRPANLISSRPASLFHREAPPRFLGATALSG